jgi:hypothetical protein
VTDAAAVTGAAAAGLDGLLCLSLLLLLWDWMWLLLWTAAAVRLFVTPWLLLDTLPSKLTRRLLAVESRAWWMCTVAGGRGAEEGRKVSHLERRGLCSRAVGVGLCTACVHIQRTRTVSESAAEYVNL